MSVWSIKESRGIGVGSLYELKKTGLTIGRNPDADIVILSKTVDFHHAMIEWDKLTQRYFIKDLGSVNGTFVNQIPLRGKSKPLEDKDSIKFGYDTDQVFRVEMMSHSAQSSSSSEINTSAATTQLDPNSILPSETLTSNSSQYMPPTIPTLGVPHIIPQVVSVMAMPTSTLITSTTSTANSFTTDIVNNKNTVHVATSTIQDEIESVKIRVDGRKPIHLSVGSPLYGCPSWWGDESDDNCASDSELRPHKHGSLILRNIEHKSEDESGRIEHNRSKYKQYLTPVSRNRTNSLTALDKNSEPQKQTDSIGTPTSFTVEFEAPKRTKPRSLHGYHPLSPGSVSPKGSLSSVEKVHTPPSSPRQSSTRRTFIKSSKAKTKSKDLPVDIKLPFGSKSKKDKSSVDTTSPSSKKNETYIINEHINDLNTTFFFHTDTPVGCSDKTTWSQPSSLQGTPDSESVSRSNSARKQWKDGGEIPHSLILASIEAHLKRLANAAEITVTNVEQFVSSFKNTQHDFSNVSGPLITPITQTELPKWKVFNKEYDSICKYISETEKSLEGIHKLLTEVLSVDHVDYEKPEEKIDFDNSEDEQLVIQSDSLEDSQILTENDDKNDISDSSDSDLYYSASSEAEDDQN